MSSNDLDRKPLPEELTELSGLHGYVAPDLIARIKAEGVAIDLFLVIHIQAGYFEERRFPGRKAIDLVLRACRTQDDFQDAWVRLMLAHTQYDLRPRDPDEP